MKPVCHPPESILRAYCKLTNHVFVVLRLNSHNSELDHKWLFDLANAMHNVGDLIAHYGDWVDDERYREFYLRPFDQKWPGPQLEQLLERYLREE